MKMKKEQLKKVETPNTKRPELSIKEKIEVLNYAKVHTERETAAKFGISKTAVNTMKKQQKELELLCKADNPTSGCRYRRVRYTKYADINDKVWKWIQQRIKSHQPVTPKMIQLKALVCAQKKGYKDFSASNGWLESFKNRYGITIHKSAVHVKEANTLAKSLSARKIREPNKEVNSGSIIRLPSLAGDGRLIVVSQGKGITRMNLKEAYDQNQIKTGTIIRPIKELQP